MGWKEYFFARPARQHRPDGDRLRHPHPPRSAPPEPDGLRGADWDLALNTVVSFATNTNLQHYNGETTLSYLSQMGAIQFLQFTSAATGICMGVAMVRGLSIGAKDMGNFYVDFVRSLTRLLIPFCFVAALILVWMGVPQTIGGYVPIKTVEGAAPARSSWGLWPRSSRSCSWGRTEADTTGRTPPSLHEPQPAVGHPRDLPDAPPSDGPRLRLRPAARARSASRGPCSSAPTCSSSST